MGDFVEKQSGKAAAGLTSAQLNAGYVRGELKLRKGQVTMRTAEGELRDLSTADASEALRAGWSFTTPQEVEAEKERAAYQTTGQQVATAIEGGLSGVTVGLSGLAEESGILGEDIQEGARKRKEHNEEIFNWSEGVGTVAPLIATGGSAGVGLLARGAVAGSRAAKVAKAAETTARALTKYTPAGKLMGASLKLESAVSAGANAAQATGMIGRAQRFGQAVMGGAAAGAIESGSLEAVDQIRQAMEEDAPLTMERLWLGADPDESDGGVRDAMGTGALWGGALNGLISGTAEAVDAVTKPALKRLIGGEGGADEIARKVLTRSQMEHLQPRTKKRRLQVDKRGKGSRAEGMESLHATALDNDVISIPGTGRAQHGNTPEEMLAAARAGRTRAGQSMEAVAERMDERALKLAGEGKATGMPKPADVASDVRRAVKKSTGGAKDLEAEIMRGPVGKALNALESKPDLLPSELWGIRKDLDHRINFLSTSDMGAGKREAMKEARSVLEGNLSTSLDDMATSSGLAPEWGPAKEQYGNLRIIEDLLGDTVSRGESRHGGESLMSGQNVVNAILGNAAFGPAGLMGALVGKAPGTIARKGGEMIMGFGERQLTKKMSAAANAGARGRELIDTTVRNMVGELADVKGALRGDIAKQIGRVGGAAVIASQVRDKFDKQFDPSTITPRQLTAAADPNSPLMRHVRLTSAPLRAVAPKLADARDQKFQSMIATLADDLDDTDASDPFSQVGEEVLAPNERAEVNRKLTIAFNPTTVLASIDDDSITHGDIETFQELHPLMYEELRSGTFAAIAGAEKMPSYAKRQTMSIVVQQPIESTLRAGFVLPTQQLANTSMGFGIAPIENAPAVTPSNTKSIELAESESTLSQHLERRQ